ncbi:MAG: tetrahydromethanopterin S-methyltransferase subunit A [Methanobacteriota archaeon]|nr:MAG: tetrahydromethanopterin S-methyltransferase subunit A [Euryarchaeota archaeon]
MLKVPPHPDYPPEEGRFLRGNDYSPAAVAIVLNTEAENIPKEIERLVRAGIESGAALSGTVQTENIGFEKLVCNIVANPNIRYLILGGPESAGHLTGEAMKALFKNGVDPRHRIIGTESPHPYLYNIPLEFIERFRKQLTLVDCQFQTEDVIRQAVWSCYLETPVEFRGYALYDPGAYPEPPLSGQITWRVTQPWAEPLDEKERVAKQRALDLIERLKAKSEERRRDQRET